MATAGQFYIILAQNTSIFRHRTKIRRKKRKFFLQFFTKTCAETTKRVGPSAYLTDHVIRPLYSFLPKNFSFGQTVRLESFPNGDPDPPPTDQIFFLTPPMSRGL